MLSAGFENAALKFEVKTEFVEFRCGGFCIITTFLRLRLSVCFTILSRPSLTSEHHHDFSRYQEDKLHYSERLSKCLCAKSENLEFPFFGLPSYFEVTN